MLLIWALYKMLMSYIIVITTCSEDIHLHGVDVDLYQCGDTLNVSSNYGMFVRKENCFQVKIPNDLESAPLKKIPTRKFAYQTAW